MKRGMMIVRVNHYFPSRCPLPLEEHERACEGITEALAMHITYFRKSAQSRCDVRHKGHQNVEKLRNPTRRSFLFSLKRQKIPAHAKKIKQDINTEAEIFKLEMQNRLMQMQLFQQLIGEQLTRTRTQYPTLADTYEKRYVALSQLLSDPVQPTQAVLVTTSKEVQTLLQTWSKIRERLMQTIRSKQFFLPPLKDLGICLPEPSPIEFAT